MPSPAFILFPSPDGWRFAAIGGRSIRTTVVPIPGDATVADVSAAVATALSEAGYSGEDVLLAVPSAWCLCASISTAGLPSKNRRQAMLYRLEEKLPVAAEDVIADFLPAGVGARTSLGVGVQKSALRLIVKALEQAGIAIAAISPAALLALQHALGSGSGAQSSLDAVVWRSDIGDALELFVLRDRQVQGWYVLSDEPADLLLHLTMAIPPRADRASSDTAEAPTTTVAVVNVRPEIQAALTKRPGVRVTPLDVSALSSAATTMAGAVLSGKATPWIDLRRGDLSAGTSFRQVRAPLTAALVAVVVCLVCATAAMLWRAGRYDELAAQHADAQQAVFRQAFPTGPIPIDVRSRLGAEERRLRESKGSSASASPSATGLITFRDLLSRLPPEDALRYRILRIDLPGQGRFTLEGQAGAHGDADVIVASLRKGGTFTVEPPRTEQLPVPTKAADAPDGSNGAKDGAATGGVSFIITGAATAELPPAKRGGQ